MAVNGLSDSTTIECLRCDGDGALYGEAAHTLGTISGAVPKCYECDGTGEMTYAQARDYAEWLNRDDPR